MSEDEFRFILTQKWAGLGFHLDITDFTGSEAIAAIGRITGGNFRLLQRLVAWLADISDALRRRWTHLTSTQPFYPAFQSRNPS